MNPYITRHRIAGRGDDRGTNIVECELHEP